MPKPLYLVVDTNLFHEFRRLEDLPWSELGNYDPIILVVTSPVQSELDEQKKDTRPKVRRRALEAVTRFRKILTANRDEDVICEAGPRVLVKLDASALPTKLPEALDREVQDDRIVAIACRLAAKLKEGEVRVFSDDTRPISKARAVGLSWNFIPEGWRRAADEDEDQKSLTRLREENDRLRRQEPTLDIASPGVSDGNRLSIEFVRYQALTSQEIDELMGKLQARHPMETNFDRATEKNVAGALPLLGFNQQSYQPAREEKIEEYRNESYPAWLEGCRAWLENAHEHLSRIEPRPSTEIVLTNSGTRPAENVLVTLHARGQILIAPTSSDDVEAEPSLGFPAPPEAPQGSWNDSISQSIFGLLRATAHTELPRLHDLTNPIPEHDPNSFYYKDRRPLMPVEFFQLTCELFRHVGTEELFDTTFYLSSPDEFADPKNACLEVSVEAANVSEPLVNTIPITLIIRKMSCVERVQQAISEIGAI